MIERTIEKHILDSVSQWPVTLITGARQVGKSTLCKSIMNKLDFEYVSLDDGKERLLANKDPEMFLKLHKSPLIIDEAQYAPKLFEEIEHIVNKQKFETGNNYGMYILTGSHAYKLMDNVTESLAGRINIVEMSPLSMSEIRSIEEKPFKVELEAIHERVKTYNIDQDELYKTIVRGMYPELYDNQKKNTETFYRNYISSYLEKDVSLLINVQDKLKFQDFLSVLASLTGQELVYETIANAVGVTSKTVKSWISVLETGNIVRTLRPFGNDSPVRKIRKHPKLYFNDTGLACSLIGIEDSKSLAKSPYKGRMIETYMVNEIIKSYGNNATSCRFHFYRDIDNREVDLVISKNTETYLVECKSGVTFGKNDVKAMTFLKENGYDITGACIICNTDAIYPVDSGVYAIPVSSI